MKTAVINIKIEPKIKEQARKVAADLGFSLSTLINSYLRYFIKAKAVHFGTEVKEEPSEYLLKALKESREDYKNGDYFSFKNPKDALKFLDDVRGGKYDDQLQ